MIKFEKYKLDNGLTVILHQDNNTSLVAVNMLYKVGSRNEHQDHTGFAHLFEHLMFTGTNNIPDFDIPIQEAGGENNAFTNGDITNFYNLVPADNLEIALYVEADRMINLNLNEENVQVQKKVVIEEFYETCLNQPYGDVWHHLSALSYKTHHYKWPTIGLVPEHIDQINLQETKTFYKTYYRPNNAILVVSGQFETAQLKEYIDKHFGPIKGGQENNTNLEQELEQKESRLKEVNADVPFNCLMMSFPMPHRQHPDFPTYDLISDLLGNGRSSRFYERLFKAGKSFNFIDAYISGTEDAGLFIIDAKLEKGVSFEEAEKTIWEEILRLVDEQVPSTELEKIINKNIASLVFSEMSVLNKAINLAYFESIGNALEINEQKEQYESITADDIQRVSKALFKKEHCNVLRYGKLNDA